MREGASAAAIFDVDGTLCATRSTTSLVWLRARQSSAWRHRLWLASLAWRAPLLWAADKLSRDLADRMVFAQFAGLSEARLHADAQACADTLLRPACFPEALAEIARHRAAGQRIVLLSGGVEPVLRPLAQALEVELIAQRLDVRDGRLTGGYRSYALLGDDHVRRTQGENKAAALQRYAEAEGIDLAASFGYGDSVNDIPFLRGLGHPVAVNPDPKLAREAAARGWEVRTWAPAATSGAA